jgi:hypothetical protein
MKRSILSCLAIITVVAAEPAINVLPKNQPIVDPVASARSAVHWQIATRLRVEYPPFSRAIAPIISPQFLAVEEVEKEKRLPFLINATRGVADLRGYVRLSDNAIFLYRPDTKDYIPSTMDPRFAPPPAPEIKTEKPA